MSFYLQFKVYFYSLIEILKSEAAGQDHGREAAMKNDDGMWNVDVFIDCLGEMRCTEIELRKSRDFEAMMLLMWIVKKWEGNVKMEGEKDCDLYTEITDAGKYHGTW